MNYYEIQEYADCNVQEMINWLFEYACRYLELEKKKLTGKAIQNIMNGKYNGIIKSARECTEGLDGIEVKIDMYWDKIDQAIRADMQDNRKRLNK